MPYLGNDLFVAQPSYRNIDDISGSFNSSATSFPLTVNGVAPVPFPINSNQCLISVAGVVQRPDDSGTEGFRISGGNIIFSSAPATGADFFGVILAGADYVNVGVNFPSGTAAVPSITFDSDLDTGIYNSGANQVSISTAGTERLRVDSAGQIESVSLGSATTPAYSFTTDPNTGIYSPGADQLAVATNGAARITVNSSGNVGIGTASPNQKVHLREAGAIGVYTQWQNNSDASIGYLGLNTDGTVFSLETNQSLRFASGSAYTERARIDSSGRLLVGTSSTSNNTRLVVQGSSSDATDGGIININRGSTPSAGDGFLGGVVFENNVGNRGALIAALSDGGGWTSGSNHRSRLVFSTTADGASSPTERMRISNNGQHDFYSSAGTVIVSRSICSASTGCMVYEGYYGATSTQTGTLSYRVYSNGNVVNANNSYGSLSDAKLKENIVDATSQWSDIKALQVRKYNFKEGQTHTQIGLVAQEVELVSPGLVSESPDRDAEGNDLGTVTKSVNYSVLYMKAVKALQEAMERIETLEASNADLLARVSALEAN